MSVAAVVRCHDAARKAAFAHLVAEFGFHRSVRASACFQPRMHPVFLALPRDYVHHAAHGIRTVQHRGGGAQHFHFFGGHCGIGISNRMPHKPHVLRVAVNKHQYSRGWQPGLGRTSYAAYGHLPRRAGRHAVAHDTARSRKESRYLRVEHWQYRDFPAFFQGLPRNHGHCHGQMP